MRRGCVYLVGAGPGDPGLVTVRGLELIRRCDVLLFDRLVARELLDEAPEAERIFVGKKPGDEHSRGSKARALMLERAKAGATVVRLKGGDPFVFGHGGEELELLAQSGVPFEVVPGVSSSIAAASYAGIPLTQRGIANSFAVVSADADSEGPVAWRELATGPDTLVLMNDVDSLRSVAARLIAHGRHPRTPAAVVEWGTLPRQRVVIGTLEDVGEHAVAAAIKTPATTYVGDVVALRGALSWFERRPLYGLRIVVTRAERQATGLGMLLGDAGADVVNLPTIEIADPESFTDVDLAVKKLAEGLYVWVVFTSANGLERFFDRVDACGYDARAFARTKVAAVGIVTAALLAERGIRADFVPETFTGEAVAGSLDRGVGGVLLPRVADGPRDIVDLLRGAGWTPEECITYRNVPASPSEGAIERVRAGNFDAVTFASASAVRSFVGLAGEVDALGLGEGADAGVKTVACIGPKTAAVAAELGLHVDVVAEEHTGEGLRDALIAHFAAPEPEAEQSAPAPEAERPDDGTMTE